MKEQAPDFSIKNILRNHLDMKIRKNSKYSLRALARDLDVSPSRLSEIMTKGDIPSRDTARKIFAKMGYAKEVQEKICDQIDASYSKVTWRRKSAKARLERFESDNTLYEYSDDEFCFIADPIHPTILSYLELSDPPKNPKQIAIASGEKEKTVIAAVERLERIGAISYEDNGDLKVVKTRTRVNTGVSPKSIREFRKTFGDYIDRSFDFQTRSQRHLDSIIYAVSKEGFEEFKEVLTETRKKLTEIAYKYERKDIVCYVNLQMIEAKKTW